MRVALNWLLEVEADDPDGGAVVLRAARFAHRTRPGESPADVYYTPRLRQPASLMREMFADRTTGGRSKAGYGECLLDNADGALEFWLRLRTDGRRLVLRLGPRDGRYPEDYPVVFSGEVASLESDGSTLSIQVRDGLANLDQPFSPVTYRGDNVLPGGVEGLADLAGKGKPRLLGPVFNLAPPLVNTAKLIYQAFEPGNRLGQSENLSLSPWVPGAGVVIGLAAATAPDGTTSATRVSAAGGGVLAQEVPVYDGNQGWAMACWLKAGSVGTVAVSLTGQGASQEVATVQVDMIHRSVLTVSGGSAQVFSLGDGWMRLHFSYPGTARTALKLSFSPLTSGDFLVWGPQLNPGQAPWAYCPTWEAGDVTACYDRGVSLVRGADYASEAEVLASPPGSGQYRVFRRGGLVRLGASPAGQLTCDAISSVSAAALGPASLVRQAALAGANNLPVFLPEELAALESAWRGTAGEGNTALGLRVSDGVRSLEVLDRLLGSLGAWYAYDRLGRLRLGRLESPAGGTPVWNLDPINLRSLTRIRGGDVGGGMPVYRVLLHYGPNETPQKDADLGGDKTSATDPVGGLARRAWLAADVRDAVAESGATRLAHPAAPILERSTCIQSQAAAAAESQRLLSLYGVTRETFEAELLLADVAAALAMEIGHLVRLTWPGLGLSGGRILVVIGMDLDAEHHSVKLTLWG